jgi:carbonic anhydrase
MRLLKELFDNNEQWARLAAQRDPRFFHRLAAQQAPQFLWVGCSDSRVPANEITGLQPGEVFVHRNIANLVKRDDSNCLAVIQYAIEVLAVRHVLVVGHYGCGGVAAAMEHGGPHLVREWLAPLREIYVRHRQDLDALPYARRWDRLCELNVIYQARAVAESPIVRSAWSRGQELAVHGWIYRIQDGRLRDLDVTIDRQTTG